MHCTSTPSCKRTRLDISADTRKKMTLNRYLPADMDYLATNGFRGKNIAETSAFSNSSTVASLAWHPCLSQLMAEQGTKYGSCLVARSTVVTFAGQTETEMAPSRSSTGEATKLKSSRSTPRKLQRKFKKMGTKWFQLGNVSGRGWKNTKDCWIS